MLPTSLEVRQLFSRAIQQGCGLALRNAHMSYSTLYSLRSGCTKAEYAGTDLVDDGNLVEGGDLCKPS